jgi:homoserine O-acetyltransferase
MIANEFYSQAVHGPYELYGLGDFALEEGGTIRDCQLAYATWGKLNAARDNAILIPTWYSGTHKIWEQVYIGPGRALDPERWFIIAVNQLGSGLSSSPHNTPAPAGMARFPHVRIGDDVRAQHQFLTAHFGLERLALVVGGSMGAQQTYEWAVRYPGFVQRAAPIAGTAKNTDHDFLCAHTLCEAITSDPAWAGGWYASNADVHMGLRHHASLWSVLGFSGEFYRHEVWRTLGFSSLADFMTNFLEAYFLPMDPNDLLCMAWKWQRGDVSRLTGGDLKAALERITAKVFVLPIDEDLLFPPRDCAIEQAMIAGSELRVLHSKGGHLALNGFDQAFLAELDGHLRDLLAIPV